MIFCCLGFTADVSPGSRCQRSNARATREVLERGSRTTATLQVKLAFLICCFGVQACGCAHSLRSTETHLHAGLRQMTPTSRGTCFVISFTGALANKEQHVSQ